MRSQPPTPAAGNGTGRILTDLERLCNIHIPSWLASPGMAADKIAQFYDDPVKRAYDDAAASWACRLRSMPIEEGFTWNLKRRLRFIASAACQLGMFDSADQVAPEGWTQRLLSRT
jgi:hypothetical protein